MSSLYLNEDSAKVSVEDNYIVVSYRDGLIRKIPIETLENIQIFGRASVTSPCIISCLKKGITLAYYSKSGAYFGRLESTGHINVERQRLQCSLYQSEYALGLSKLIIAAKIHNQSVVLRRYARSSEVNVQNELREIKYFKEKVETSKTVEQLMGYEGSAAKYYFEGLSKTINPDFKFKGRNRRPPKDPFNSMLSLGYSILMNEIYGKIVLRGLNPYFGYMHADREKHPTLASDLMEEWRAVLIDSMVMSMINGNEIQRDEFYTGVEEPGVFLTSDGMKKFIKKYDIKIKTKSKYFGESELSFRQAMDTQISKLILSMENNDYTIYEPLKIR